MGLNSPETAESRHLLPVPVLCRHLLDLLIVSVDLLLLVDHLLQILIECLLINLITEYLPSQPGVMFQCPVTPVRIAVAYKKEKSQQILLRFLECYSSGISQPRKILNSLILGGGDIHCAVCSECQLFRKKLGIKPVILDSIATGFRECRRCHDYTGYVV